MRGYIIVTAAVRTKRTDHILAGCWPHLHRLIVRMLGGCCRKTTARFVASLTGRMVAHNVLAQGGGRGSKRWEEAKKGGKTMSVNKEDSQLLSS